MASFSRFFLQNSTLKGAIFVVSVLVSASRRMIWAVISLLEKITLPKGLSRLVCISGRILMTQPLPPPPSPVLVTMEHCHPAGHGWHGPYGGGQAHDTGLSNGSLSHSKQFVIFSRSQYPLLLLFHFLLVMPHFMMMFLILSSNCPKNVFTDAMPLMVTTSFASGYLMAMAAGNLGGRIGKKKSFYNYFL